MLRNFFLLINLFPIIFLFNSAEFSKEELKVEVNAPEAVKPGDEFTVEIKITGGSVTGFAKYIDILPQGFSAEAVDIGDATFTADNGQVKILWVSFPDQDQVSLSYKVKVDVATNENLTIGGKFSYLENNEKQVYSVFKKKVMVGAEAVLASAPKEKVPVSVSVTRKITKSRDDVHEIQLTVSQTGLEGFGKIQEYVPMGAIVEKGEVENAAFSYVRNKVKFVWMTLPSSSEYVITYMVDLSDCSQKDPKSITGEFSYLDDDVTKKVDIKLEAGSGEMLVAANSEASSNESDRTEEKEEIDASKNSVSTEVAVAVATPEIKKEEEEMDFFGAGAEEETQEEETEEIAQQIDNEQEVKEEPEEIEEEAVAVVAVEEVEKEENKSVAAMESKPQASNNEVGLKGLVYRVQIAAGKKVVGQDYFQKRHEFSDDFVVENHQGWVKYTTGSFSMYKDARDSREDISNAGHKFDGPFVTAYNNGDRITVQEALMISNQRWFK